MTGNSENIIIDWLQTQHDDIMSCENAALASMKAGDISDYRKKMHDKAIMLSGIAESFKKSQQGSTGELGDLVYKTLASYSRNAETALQLDSVFYMSALLYPDEYKAGEPDNFQKFIDSLKNTSSDSVE